MLKKLIKSLPQQLGIKIFKKEKQNFIHLSYSQCGEDLIVRFIFTQLQIRNPSYIDIGAHHPHYLSNTALFYKTGSRGINIEPDPSLFITFIKDRKFDINLNIGISDKSGEKDFYIMNHPTLNTFSQDEANKYKSEGNYFVKEIKKIPTKNIQSVLNDFFQGKFPDFLSIDAEGIDEVVINSIDYSINYPKVICVETISFSEKGTGEKNNALIDFIKSKGYMYYADTYVNSIFVKQDLWVR